MRKGWGYWGLGVLLVLGGGWWWVQGGGNRSPRIDGSPVAPTESPGVEVYGVHDRLLAVTVEVNDLLPQGQQPYRPQWGDWEDAQGWLYRYGRPVGRVVGREEKSLYRFDRWVPYEVNLTRLLQIEGYDLQANVSPGNPPPIGLPRTPQVVALSHKAKIIDSARLGPWDFGFRKRHTLFLTFDRPLIQQQSYTLRLPPGGIDLPQGRIRKVVFIYNPEAGIPVSAAEDSNAQVLSPQDFDPQADNPQDSDIQDSNSQVLSSQTHNPQTHNPQAYNPQDSNSQAHNSQAHNSQDFNTQDSNSQAYNPQDSDIQDSNSQVLSSQAHNPQAYNPQDSNYQVLSSQDFSSQTHKPQAYNPQDPNSQVLSSQAHNSQAHNPQDFNTQDSNSQAYNPQDSNYQVLSSQDFSSQTHNPQAYNPQDSNSQVLSSQAHNSQAYNPQDFNTQDSNSQAYNPQDSNSQVLSSQAHNSQAYNPQDFNSQAYNPQAYNPQDPNSQVLSSQDSNSQVDNAQGFNLQGSNFQEPNPGQLKKFKFFPNIYDNIRLVAINLWPTAINPGAHRPIPNLQASNFQVPDPQSSNPQGSISQGSGADMGDPQPLEPGDGVSLGVSEAIHLNQWGFDPQDGQKFAYVSLWTGLDAPQPGEPQQRPRVGHEDGNGYRSIAPRITKVAVAISPGHGFMDQTTLGSVSLEPALGAKAGDMGSQVVYRWPQKTNLSQPLTLTYTIVNAQGETWTTQAPLVLRGDRPAQAEPPLPANDPTNDPAPQPASLPVTLDFSQSQAVVTVRDLINWAAQTQNLRVTPRFWVIDRATGTIAHQGQATLTHLPEEAQQIGLDHTGSDVYRLDFSALDRPGTYHLVVQGTGRSRPFTLSPQIWDQLLIQALAGLYHQRSGIALGPPYTDWVRPRSLHPADGLMVLQAKVPLVDTQEGLGSQPGGEALRATGTNIPVPEAWGGWHDAGDWDRRIQHTDGVRLLLELAELAPLYAKNLGLAIPERDNALPDVVDEALWGLDVFRRIQHSDGGVPGGIEGGYGPEVGEGSWQEEDPWFVYAPDAWSSYEYASAAAQAAWVLRGYDRPRAQIYETSALKAMAWAEAHPLPLHNPRQRQEIPQARNLAAAHLYRLTGDPQWHELFLATSLYGPQSSGSPGQNAGWNPGKSLPQGDAAFIYTQTPHPRHGPTLERSRQALIADGDHLRTENIWFPFGQLGDRYTPVGWGGGGAIPNRGMALVRAHYLTGDRAYRDLLVTGTQFTLGANPDNLSLMTGNKPESPHGRTPQDPLLMDTIALGGQIPPGIVVFGSYSLADYDPFGAMSLYPPDLTPQGFWPVNESFQDFQQAIPMAEFTVQQTIIPCAYVWGYLAATDSDSPSPGQAP